MEVFELFKREMLHLYRRVALIGIVASFGVMVVFFMITNAKAFRDYTSALFIAYIISVTAMLIGIALAVSLISGDYAVIRRELRMGISPVKMIWAKFFLTALMCLVMSFILFFPYLLNTWSVEGINMPYLYFAIFFTMLSSSAVGLLVSAVCRNNLSLAMIVAILVILLQILFSSHLYSTSMVDALSWFTFSKYSIRAIGSALGFAARFDHNIFNQFFDFERTWRQVFENLPPLTVFVIIGAVASAVILYRVDKKGCDVAIKK